LTLPEAKQTTDSAATNLWFVALLAAFVILPVFLVDIPAMKDYPNHLARMYLLSAIGTPEENPYYIVDWRLCPNLAMDLIVPPMARFMGVAAATKAFLVLSQALVISGTVALEIVIKKRHQFAGFVGAMVLYSNPFAWGFLNFEFGTGMALWGIASWCALKRRQLHVRFLVHSLFVFGLFFAHLFALGLYGATVGLCELYSFRKGKVNTKKAALIVTLLIGPVLILLVCAIQSDTQIGNGRTVWLVFPKLASIVYALDGYSVGLSALYVSAFFLLLYFLFRSRQLSFIAAGKWIAVGFLILFIAIPFRLIGGSYTEVRILTAVFLIMPAFLVFSPTRQELRFLPPLVLSVIALLNAGHVAAVWLTYRPEYDSLKSSFALIKRGAFVLIAVSGDGRNERNAGPMVHAPVLAVHYAKAFVPTLFTLPGQYVLQVRPDLKRRGIADAGYSEVVPFSSLAAIAKDPTAAGMFSHLVCWMDNFDYLYLVGSQKLHSIPDCMTAIAEDRRFTLFRINMSLGKACF
jgi:hypothetical protein